MCDNKKLEIKDLLGLSAPLEKLIDVISKGVGVLYAPVQNERMTEAKAKEISKISNAIKENAVLPIEYKDGKLFIDSSNTNDLADRAQLRLTSNEMRRQNNIDRIIQRSIEILQNEDFVSAETVDEDWITRFFDIAQDINSENMQRIWSKILSNEIIRPGSFSLRTLEVVRNLSSYEANTFQKLLPFILNSDGTSFVINTDDILNKFIEYGDILTLDDCGIINSVGLTNYEIQLKIKDDATWIHNKDTAIIFHNDKDDKNMIEFRTFPLTRAGEELYEILSAETNNDYMDYIHNYFSQRYEEDISIYLKKISSSTTNVLYCDDGTVFTSL